MKINKITKNAGYILLGAALLFGGERVPVGELRTLLGASTTIPVVPKTMETELKETREAKKQTDELASKYAMLYDSCKNK